MLSRHARIVAAVLSGVTASLLVTAATAQAAQDRPVVVYGEPQQASTERVPYGDLNLAAATDRKALYGRVGYAVRKVCNFDSIGIASDYRTCSAGAWKDARPQIERAIAKADRLALSGANTSFAGAITIRALSR